jgi:hypothetical protein
MKSQNLKESMAIRNQPWQPWQASTNSFTFLYSCLSIRRLPFYPERFSCYSQHAALVKKGYEGLHPLLKHALNSQSLSDCQTISDSKDVVFQTAFIRHSLQQLLIVALTTKERQKLLKFNCKKAILMHTSSVDYQPTNGFTKHACMTQYYGTISL